MSHALKHAEVHVVIPCLIPSLKRPGHGVMRRSPLSSSSIGWRAGIRDPSPPSTNEITNEIQSTPAIC
jgi:hypothetical protein